jgi:D-alanine-D-alanine ligase
MVESYVAGREFTVGIFDGEPLPLIEVLPQREFFDFEAKYTDKNTQYCIPVPLLESLYRKTQEVALRAYNSLGCRHMGRVDLIYGYDGRLYVLEVNTIPGFTPRSLLPMAARYAGIEFIELCSRIVELALRDAEQLPRGASMRKRETA